MYKYVDAIYETLLNASSRTMQGLLSKETPALRSNKCLLFGFLCSAVNSVFREPCCCSPVELCINQKEIHNLCALAER